MFRILVELRKGSLVEEFILFHTQRNSRVAPSECGTKCTLDLFSYSKESSCDLCLRLTVVWYRMYMRSLFEMIATMASSSLPPPPIRLIPTRGYHVQ